MALERAARLCSSREHTVSDISTKLTEWGLSPENTKKAIDLLIKEKYIDESRYAGYFVKDKFRLSKWGRIKIRYALLRKQIPEKIIEEAIDGIDKEAYRETCLELLRQKDRTLKKESILRRKSKLMQFAIQRGFETGLVYEVIEEVTGNKR